MANLLPPRALAAWLGLLLVLGIVAGAGWRIELEAHGWDGLGWLRYFHAAIPAGVALLWLWVVGLARKLHPGQPRHVLRVAVIGAGAALVLAWLTVTCLRGLYAWPMSYAFVTLDIGGKAQPLLQRGLMLAPLLAPVLTLLVLPLLLYLLARRLRFPVRRRNLAIGYGLLLGNIALCIVLIDVLGLRGGADFIHTIKSGLIVPGWMLGLGVLFVPVP